MIMSSSSLSLHAALTRATSTSNVELLDTLTTIYAHEKQASQVVCFVAALLNVVVLWSALAALRNGTAKTSFAFLANLALADLMAAVWFLNGLALKESNAWTDMTTLMLLHAIAKERDLVKPQDSNFRVNFVQLTLENCGDHLVVFSSWLSLLVLSIDRFVFIVHGLAYGHIMRETRVYRGLACMWATALLLAFSNLIHINGTIMIVRRIISSVWQLAFFSTTLIVLIFFSIILHKRRQLYKRLASRDRFNDSEDEGRRGSRFSALSLALQKTAKELRSTRYILAIIGSIVVGWLPCMIFFAIYTQLGLQAMYDIVSPQHYDLDLCSDFDLQLDFNDGELENAFDLVACLLHFQSSDGPECRVPINQVYSNATIFCEDARYFMRSAHLTTLSNCLMQLACINPLLDPIIYAFWYGEFRVRLVRQSQRIRSMLHEQWEQMSTKRASITSGYQRY